MCKIMIWYTPIYHPKNHLMSHSLSAWSGPSGTNNASASILALIAASPAGFSRRYSFCMVHIIITVHKKAEKC